MFGTATNGIANHKPGEIESSKNLQTTSTDNFVVIKVLAAEFC
jgi:hypothetical protein